MSQRLRVATTSLAGCFGCHMSLLDIDLALAELADKIEFDRTPLTDIKEIHACDLGLIEGGLCNAENVEVLREFRRHCTTLVAVGACAITGGIPALRNQFRLADCLDEAYVHGMGLSNRGVPDDPELPLLLDRVHPIQEVVEIDYFLPGCPPTAASFLTLFAAVLAGRPLQLEASQIHYD